MIVEDQERTEVGTPLKPRPRVNEPKKEPIRAGSVLGGTSRFRIQPSSNKPRRVEVNESDQS